MNPKDVVQILNVLKGVVKSTANNLFDEDNDEAGIGMDKLSLAINRRIIRITEEEIDE